MSVRILTIGALTAVLAAAPAPAFEPDALRPARPSGGAGSARTTDFVLPGGTGRPAPTEGELLRSITSRVPVLASLGPGTVQSTAFDRTGVELWISPAGVRGIAAGDGDAADRVLAGLRTSDGRSLATLRDTDTIGVGDTTVGELRDVLRAAQRGDRNVFVRLDMAPGRDGPVVVGMTALRFVDGPGRTAPAGPTGGPGVVAGPAPVAAPAGPAASPGLIVGGSRAERFLSSILPAERIGSLVPSVPGTLTTSGVRVNPGERPGQFFVRVDLNNVHDETVSGLIAFLPHVLPAAQVPNFRREINDARAARPDSAGRLTTVTFQVNIADSTWGARAPTLVGPIEVRPYSTVGGPRPTPLLTYTPPDRRTP